MAIDNKIEQAMDLVKSHLMFAVREEVEVLKERIAELMVRIAFLESENSILRAAASQVRQPSALSPQPSALGPWPLARGLWLRPRAPIGRLVATLRRPLALTLALDPFCCGRPWPLASPFASHDRLESPFSPSSRPLALNVAPIYFVSVALDP